MRKKQTSKPLEAYYSKLKKQKPPYLLFRDKVIKSTGMDKFKFYRLMQGRRIQMSKLDAEFIAKQTGISAKVIFEQYASN